MAIPLSAPLSAETIAELRAGDAVALTGQILVLNLCSNAPGASMDAWVASTRPASDGWICCIALSPCSGSPSHRWTVARIDEPEADRVACAVLAAGSRGLVCRGRCLPQASYAVRKYGGVCLGAAGSGFDQRVLGGIATAPVVTEIESFTFVTLHHTDLVVTHDAQGRQFTTDD